VTQCVVGGTAAPPVSSTVTSECSFSRTTAFFWAALRSSGMASVSNNASLLIARSASPRAPRKTADLIQRQSDDLRKALGKLVLGILSALHPTLATCQASILELVKILGRCCRVIDAHVLGRLRHSKRKALKVLDHLSNALVVAAPLWHLVLDPTTCLIHYKASHL